MRYVLAFALPFLVTTAAPIGAVQNIHGTLVDAGGNGGQYGIVFIRGPLNRVQSQVCPGGRGSLGGIPTGTTTCDSSFNNPSAPDEWQAGDVLIARAPVSTTTDIPFELRTDGIYLCYITFEGWSGPCTGKGPALPGAVHECEFTLPPSGNIEIGAAFSGEIVGGGACPAIPFTATTTTTTPGTSTTTIPGQPSGLEDVVDHLTDDLLTDIRKLNDFYDWLRRNPAIGAVLPPRPSKQSLIAELSALNGTPGTLRAMVGAGQRVVLSRARAKVAKGARSTRLRFKTTRVGRRLLKLRTLADVQLTVTGQSKPDGAATRTVSIAIGNQ